MYDRPGIILRHKCPVIREGLIINSFKPGVPFVGQRQQNSPRCGTFANRIAPDVTPQNAASHLGLFCLLREISSKNEIINKNHS